MAGGGSLEDFPQHEQQHRQEHWTVGAVHRRCGSHGGLEQISAGELSLRASHFRNRLPRCAPIFLRPDEQRIARRARLLTNNITAAHLSYGRLGCTRMEIMSAVSVEI